MNNINSLPIFGKVVLSSGWYMQDGKMIGFGTVTKYDDYGNIVSVKTEPTGLVMVIR